MYQPASVLVVGASAAGLSTVEALRRNGYQGSITVLGAEPELPYDRPPLSKQVLAGSWTAERTRLRSLDQLADLHAEFILGNPAVAFDAGSRVVHAESGLAVQADTVVIATGVRPRTPFGAGEGVHVLRTLDDALALRRDLATATRMVVVGEGVLGAEIAATASAAGLRGTVVGPRPALMLGPLGPEVAHLLGELHTARGVELRLGSGVTEVLRRDGLVTGVRLDTGVEIAADVVAVAAGAVPATEWLVGSGLTLDDGVVCDSRCRAAAGVYAVGDVARWHHDRVGGLVRWENRTNAVEQAAAVAADVLGADQPYTPVPYFWTDQFDARIQVHGTVPADAEAEIVEGSLDSRRFVARYHHDGRVTGLVGWNMPKQARLHRRAVVDTWSPDVAVL